MDEVIEYLNSKTGRRYKPEGKNLTLVAALLKDHTVEEIKNVIDAKCLDWVGDAKMEMYLRPQTLFSKSNFQGYFEQLNPDKNESLTPRQIEHRLYLKTPQWLSKREKVIQRANHRCEGCGAYLGTLGQVHHKTYDNWKDEFLFELIYLCSDCHSRVHGRDS